MKLNKITIVILTVFLMFTCVACGNTETGLENTEGLVTEDTQEKEPEFRVEIADAADILTKTWDVYKEEERFEIMGGHFSSAQIGVPAKFDLAEAVDLELMYCVPEEAGKNIDDAATMIDFYNAGRFTAGAYHVADVANVESFIQAVETQVQENEWHGETPKKLLILKIDEQYVVCAYGREPLVNEFELNLKSIYQTMVTVEVEVALK